MLEMKYQRTSTNLAVRFAVVQQTTLRTENFLDTVHGEYVCFCHCGHLTPCAARFLLWWTTCNDRDNYSVEMIIDTDNAYRL